MNASIPSQVLRCLSVITQHGFSGFLVGGCVRDLLIGASPKDWDVASDALPTDIKRIFSDHKTVETGVQYGTVTVQIDGMSVEVTTFRGEGGYTDGRHPDRVTFIGSLEDDLSRRDFTMNAIAMDEKGTVIDPYGGRCDLQSGIIRCVGDPLSRFSEDPLRILRAVRFSCILGFTVESETKKALIEASNDLRKISAERISSELRRIFAAAPDAFCELSVPIMKGIFGCPCDSYYIEALRESDAVWETRLCLFLMAAKTSDRDSLLRWLRLDRHTNRLVGDLLDIASDPPELSEQKAAREFAASRGRELTRLCRSLFEALSRSDRAYEEHFRLLDDALHSGAPLEIGELSITGDALLKAGFQSGVGMGDILSSLLFASAADPSLNIPEKLLGYALEVFPR